ncbi:MAG: hypothetical protein AAGB12_15535, partial [Pseudomonadota bacterium]
MMDTRFPFKHLKLSAQRRQRLRRQIFHSPAAQLAHSQFRHSNGTVYRLCRAKDFLPRRVEAAQLTEHFLLQLTPDIPR